MTPSEQITTYIEGFTDWRGQLLARVRELTLETAPELAEEWKWKSPVWSHNGLISSVSAFKSDVRITFFQGASLSDPQGIFNAGNEAKMMRSIKLGKNDTLNEAAFQDMLRAAVAHNANGG